MKKTTSFIVLLALIFCGTNAHAASSAISTRIDVTGATNADCVWFITNPLCTHNFDNGWDGYETNTSSTFVQLFAQEIDNSKYQIDAVNDVNEVNLYFKSGIDTVYTLSVMHQNLSNAYKVLYLYDVVMDTLIDITTAGVKYVFKTPKQQPASKRFVMYTSSPQWVDGGGIPTSVSDASQSPLVVYSISSTVFVRNDTDLTFSMDILQASTGIVVSHQTVTPNQLNEYPTDLKPGVYIVVINTNFCSKTVKFKIN